MKHFEFSVMIALMMLPVIITIIGCLVLYGWGLAIVPAFMLLGAFGVALYIIFPDELEEYRKHTSERV